MDNFSEFDIPINSGPLPTDPYELARQQRIEGIPYDQLSLQPGPLALMEPPQGLQPGEFGPIQPMEQQPIQPPQIQPQGFQPEIERPQLNEQGYYDENQNQLDFLESPGTQQQALDKGDYFQDVAEQNQINQQQQAELSAQHAQEIEQLATESDERIQSEIDEMKIEYDKYKKMDIKDYWHDKPTWQRVAMAISVGLGAYASSMGGGRNNALDMLNKYIDMDFQKQKTALDKQFQSFKVSKSNVELVNNIYKSKLQKLKIKNLAKTEKVGDEIKKRMGSLKGTEAQLKGKELLLGIEQKKAILKDDALTGLNKKIASEKKAQTDHINRLKVQSTKSTALTEKPMSAYSRWRVNDIKQGRQVAGWGEGINDRSAKLMNESVANTNEVLGILGRIEELGDGITKMDRENVGRLSTNIRVMIGKLRIPLTGGGPLTASEQGLIKDVIGDPSKLFSTESIQSGRVGELKRILNKQLEYQAKQHILDYKPKGKEPVFPLTVRKDGFTATVQNEKELAEAQAEGFN